MRLRDRVAIVTGGSRGISRANATALAREGAHVAIASRDAARATEACGSLEALGVRALPVPTDVSRLADIEAMIQTGQAIYVDGGRLA